MTSVPAVPAHMQDAQGDYVNVPWVSNRRNTIIVDGVEYSVEDEPDWDSSDDDGSVNEYSGNDSDSDELTQEQIRVEIEGLARNLTFGDIETARKLTFNEERLAETERKRNIWIAAHPNGWAYLNRVRDIIVSHGYETDAIDYQLDVPHHEDDYDENVIFINSLDN